MDTTVLQNWQTCRWWSSVTLQMSERNQIWVNKMEKEGIEGLYLCVCVCVSAYLLHMYMFLLLNQQHNQTKASGRGVKERKFCQSVSLLCPDNLFLIRLIFICRFPFPWFFCHKQVGVVVQVRQWWQQCWHTCMVEGVACEGGGGWKKLVLPKWINYMFQQLLLLSFT